MNIAAVVIWFNPTVEFVKNIESYSKFVYKTIVVDNSSDDNSKLLNEHPEVEYISLKTNTGIGSALNIGYERALGYSAEWVLTMDQDSWFDELAIRTFLDPNSSHFTEKGCAVFSPTFEEVKAGIAECNSVISSGSLVQLSAHTSIAGYNEKLFIDQVDHEYCYRLKRFGFRILKLNHIVMHHTVGEPITKEFFGMKISSDNHTAIRKYYIARNVLYMRKYFSDFGGQHIKFLLITALKVILVESDKLNKLLYMVRGTRDYILSKMGPVVK